MEKKNKGIGTLALPFSILCLAFAIIFLVLGLNKWAKQLPEILKTVSDASGQVDPIMKNVDDMELLIPQVMQEVEAVRKTVDDALSKTEDILEILPGTLADIDEISKQIDSTLKQLPGIIDPVLKETQKTREIIPDILEEVRKTRAEIPLMMDRADNIIAGANEAGRKAGKGAMTGMIGGIISMPFDVVGGIGRGVTSLLGTEVGEAMNEEDVKIFKEKIIGLAENGNEGDVVTWKNPETSIGGKMTLVRKYLENSRECREIKLLVSVKGKTSQTKIIRGCRQPDGSWAAIE